MHRLFFTAVLIFAQFTSAFALDVLVSPDALAKLLETNEVKLLDIRALEGQGIAGYRSGHLKDALNAPYALWRGSAENPGELKSDEEFSALVSATGLVPADKVVIVNVGDDSSDFGAAARVYWTLKSLGFSQLSILDGGMFAWSEQGMPVDTDTVEITPSALSLSFDTQWLATEEDVYDIVEGDAPGLLLDARPEEFFIGKMKHRMAIDYGTIEGAQMLNNLSLFPQKSAIVGVAKDSIIEKIRAVTSDTSGEMPLVNFCNTGHWAATNWFFASELAGQKNAKLFAESVVGWTAMGNGTVIGKLN